MSIQTYEMVGFWYWWILNVLGTLGFFNVSSFLVETCWKVKTAFVVLSIPQFNKTGVILLKLVITRLVDIKINIKIFTPIAPATTPESLLVFLNIHR